jgi:hypothetical protein
LNDDGEDADEVRTHELIGKGKDSKVGKLIKHTKPPKEFFEEVEEMEEASNLALRGLFSTDPKRAGQFLSTQKGKENRAKKNVPELKSAIKRQLGRHPKPNLPEEYVEEAIEDTLHPAGAALLKHIKPEHHNLYKPHLTKDVFNGSYGDRTSVLKAAKDAGHLKMDLKKQNEEVGELDELDTGTLKQYAKKAMNKTMSSAKKGDMETSNKRSSGLTKAIDRLNKREPLDSGKSMKSVMKNWHKEDVESLEERTLTSDETAAKEKIVHGMKKSLKGFKARYGDRAKEVMYATATKQAKKD